ncbi:uncharacterized protein BJ171DRAFT_57348 [Polychytrium aggregatum]|uniref:uncharacterized protein n=1 Tax=Polychytrium aggregatum TaxID=110093 RepID=UPI0022FE9F5C|nr:uncharacterized protein BJ171DRAFT_57348 [Polychytrium aggregatum]KAI9190781.1 hypothetical protein BJ171DRAFT_57348 [Polychytrium aggregatum]
MWFPSLRCYQLITTRFLHLPTIDLGKSKVTPTLRGAILLASSLEYRCFYSAARSASFGDAMSGSARSHLWRSKTYTGEYPVPIISPSDSRLSKEESVALHLAVSAAQIPSKVTPEHKSTARSFYKGEDYQQIATICAYTGWINAFSDAMGIDLDPGSYLWAKVQLRDSLWDGSRHAPFNYDPSQGHDQLRERAQAEEYIPKHGISKARDILKILKSMQGSNSSEAQWIRGFPAGHRLLNSWLHEQFGFKPSYVEVILNRDTKRTVCYLLWQVLLRASWDNLTGAHCQCEWSAASKALLWYAYAAHSGNTLVQAHAGYLAFRLKVPVSTITMVGGNGYLGDRRMDAALEFFRESAQMTRDYSPSQSMRLFEVMKTPSGVVELISLLGMCALVHRLSVTLAPDPLRFEPEVAQFLTTDAGSALLIDPSTPYLGLVK